MAEKKNDSTYTGITNPTERAAADISDAVEEIDVDNRDVEIVDPKLRKKAKEIEERQKAKKAEAEKVREAVLERMSAPVVARQSERNDARLLIITRDVRIMEEDEASLKRIFEYAQMFAEVHVIVLSVRSAAGSHSTKRVGDDIWLYPTNSRFWWKTFMDAKHVAGKQLVFGESFRPDLIIAEDPFESGMAGKAIAHAYNRPFEVHVEENFFAEAFATLQPHNRLRKFITRLVLPHASCVRTTSEYLKDKLLGEFDELNGRVEIFPIFYDLESWDTAPQTINLKEKFPQFRFLLLHVSTMDERSHTESVIDGIFYILRQYTSIGLVIIGEGPRRGKIEEMVTEYNLTKQVVFASKSTDVLSSMRSADVLIHASSEVVEDEIVLKGATVGIPMVCGNVGLAVDIFRDEESVLLCPLNSPPCFGEKLNRLLNDNALRESLVLNARTVVKENITQDYELYLRAYRESIERCLVEGVRKR